MNKEKFDVAVIGSGPGGYVAAIRLAQLGKKTCIIEKENLGGVCLNWGCIPTKALLHTAEVYTTIKHAENHGIKVENVSFDFQAIIQKSRKTSKTLNSGIASLMKKNKITVFMGTAKIAPNYDIVVEEANKVIEADKIIVATGARAKAMPGFEVDGKIIWSYKEAMTPEKLPKSLVIVGAGVIGVEFASFYNMMGCEVTLLEYNSRILTQEDEEIVKLAAQNLQQQGIKIITNAQVKSATKSSDGVLVEFSVGGKNEQIKAENLLMAVGVVGNVENFGLENTKVKLDRNSIVTNSYCKTDDDKIYAIGDVASAPWLAHKASHEGIIAAENIAGIKTHIIKKTDIPGCIYSNPQIASVGLSEKAAQDLGIAIRVGRFPFVASGKAVAIGETFGLIKTIFDQKTGELLGAHMTGPNVTELISNFVLAKSAELTEAEFISTIFAHPTLSESLHESVLSAYGRAIHF
ncbi:MAG: dihydrolipoyl dehydrogenase [Rickettsiaceae bacterium]|nr:dihydrolipoyl dehydrogenase [Rickettsiaceae bacterium]